jgi:hypothetical protein
MERAAAHGIAAGAVATARAGSCWPVTAATIAARFGKVFDTGDALGDIGNIFTWTAHVPFS